MVAEPSSPCHHRATEDSWLSFTNSTPDTARWEQAFSCGGGAAWRSNWTMDLTWTE
ncbi:hypothetical protein [Streptomyces sp. NPDC060022]|uniref:hypothetical protein n=1 Tax=Streptomyces sp. NPDC060022 TaxID=3347039 RepID=UPI0036927D7F